MPHLVRGDKTISLGEDDVTFISVGDISSMKLSVDLHCCGLCFVHGNNVYSQPLAIVLPSFSQNNNKCPKNV